MDQRLPRLAGPSLAERLRVMPAAVVTGARQTGKSTLARDKTLGDRRYVSLDDLDVIDAARRDPDALVGGDQPLTIDEVQRHPELLHAGETGDRPAATTGPVPPDGIGKPAAHETGFRVVGRTRELPESVADDAPRAAGTR